MNGQTVVGRLEHWAAKILNVKERKLVLVAASLLAGVILLGTAWEKSEPFRRLFERASSDAGEISRIKDEAKQQREIIASVSRDATSARREMEGAAQLSADAKDQSDLATHKAAEVGRLLEQANAAVESTRTTADFAFMLARAAADDRTAFDELLSNANDESSRFHKLALAAIVRIAADLGSNLTFGLDWTKIGFDPATADFADFVDFFRRRPTFDQPQILSTLSGQERFSKFDRFSFLDDVIEVTESILVLNAACRAMNEEAHIDKNIIGYSMYRDWWRMRASRNTSPRSIGSPAGFLPGLSCDSTHIGFADASVRNNQSVNLDIGSGDALFGFREKLRRQKLDPDIW